MLDLHPGERISEYLLDELIGRGAFGQVWKAHHHVWESQFVAIKIPTDSLYVRNLRREGVAIHGLRHPNIVRAIGFDPYADVPYLVMELVDGVSLRQLLDAHSHGLPVQTVERIFRGILHALEHAHANGVIHRDIKPANVLIAGGGRKPPEEIVKEDVKVMDFGLGQTVQITAESILQSGSLAGADGHGLAGTLAYMAPEQREGERADGRSDLYAAGIVLFEMLTGRRPTGGDLPSDLRDGLPAWTNNVYSRLYTRWERRLASAGEVLEAITTTCAVPRTLPPSRATLKPARSDEPVVEVETLALDLGGVLLDLLLIPAGEYSMGSPDPEDRRGPDEVRHQIRITQPFYLGKFQVTQTEWMALMGRTPSHFKGDQLPVEQVSWNDCQEFCKRATHAAGRRIRLPTEAEWEYACRAGTTTPYSFGAAVSTDQANYDGRSASSSAKSGKIRQKTTPVGSFPSNPWGLCDMHGNVWEWCHDWYGEYPTGSQMDPQGPNFGTDRILRGGSWSSSAHLLRSALRFRLWPGDHYNYLGFRIAAEA